MSPSITFPIAGPSISSSTELEVVVSTPVATAITRVIIGIQYPGLEIEEVCFDQVPASGAGFKTAYQALSAVVATTGGGNTTYTFTILRSPVWPDSPQIWVYAFDVTGGYSVQSLSYFAYNAPPPSFQIPAEDLSPTIVGGGGTTCDADSSDQAFFMAVLKKAYPSDYWNSIGATPTGGQEIFYGFAKLGERVSKAISRLQCGAFLMTATGGSYATGVVEFSRAVYTAGAYTIQTGTVVSDAYGRRFATTADASFGATDLGPITAPIQAVLYGYEYNLPGQVITAAGEVLEGAIGTITTLKTVPATLDTALVVNNVLPTSGGVSADLDALGHDLDLPRVLNESDDVYRLRIFTTPDTISPNAICRGVTSILSACGTPWCCLREVGTPRLPGFYLDVDYYDYNLTLNPQFTWHVLLDIASMAGFFVVGVPPLVVASSGFYFDVSTAVNSYLDTPASSYDGSDVLATGVYQAIQTMIQAKKAGGVGFHLYLETQSCAY